MSSLDKAIQLAVKTHAGQTRKNGTPYILHPIRVMLRLTDPTAMIVAILHDVVEDTPTTFEDLQRAGFSEGIIASLRLLTHEETVAYPDYVAAIAPDPIARSVKLADLQDNMNIEELPSLTERNLANIAKYHAAWLTLKRYEATAP